MSDNYKTDCRFSELSISYLYGEIDNRDRAAFESHLEKCAACAQEIKGYDLVRDSIGHWKKNEFDLLATPKIEFVSDQPAKTAASLKSRFADIGKLFVSSKVLAAGSAFVLLLTVIILFSQMFLGDNEIARLQKENPQKTERASVVSVEENVLKSENVKSDETAALSVEKKMTTAPSDKNLIGKETKQNSANNQINETEQKSTIVYSTKSDNKPFPEKSKLKQASAATIKMPGAPATITRKPKSLKLNPLEEEAEEVSPRLTDLFEAVGEK